MFRHVPVGRAERPAGRLFVPSRLAALGVAATLVAAPILAAPAAFAAEGDPVSVESAPIVDPASDAAASAEAPTEEAAAEEIVPSEPAVEPGEAPAAEEPAPVEEAPTEDVTLAEAAAPADEAAPVEEAAPAAEPILVPAAAALPFAVTSPAVGSTVNTTTPVFTGTGTTGNTIEIRYSGNGLQTYVAGRTVVQEDGSWSTATSFTELRQGESDVRTLTFQFAPDGTEVGSRLATSFAFAESPSIAAPLTVVTPAEGSVSSEFLNLPRFEGTATPGSTITISYVGAEGTRVNAGVGEADGDGNYSILTNFGQLTPGQTVVTANLRATNDQGAAVGSPFQVDRTFSFQNAPVEAQPFTITSPVQNATVDTPTPTFTGTGIPGDTVKLVYSGQGLQNYTAGETIIGLDGTWSVVTDFSSANPGATEIRVSATAFSPEGVARPGSFFRDINFAVAPVQEFEFTLVTPAAGAEVEDFAAVTYEGTGAPGNTVTVTYFDNDGDDDLSVAGTGIVDEEGNFSIEASFTAIAEGQDFVNTFTTQTTPDGGLAAAVIARDIFLATPPVVEQLAPPVLDPAVVDGNFVTITGTGVAGADVVVAIAPPLAEGEVQTLAVEGAILTTTADADGRFTVSVELADGEYQATALQATGDATNVSLPSNVISFSVPSVVVPEQPGTPGQPGTGGDGSGTAPAGNTAGQAGDGDDNLAATGADSSGTLLLGLMMLLAGLGAVVIRRRAHV